jgi:hypothetical protein
VFFCLSKLAPAFPGVPSRSFLFPRGARCVRVGVGHRAGCGIFAGQRPVALVGVTGFEPAASSSRTGDHRALPCWRARAAASGARKQCVWFIQCGRVLLGLFLFCSLADLRGRRAAGDGAELGS